MLRTYAEPINDMVMVKIPKEYASYSFQVILVPYNATPRPSAAADIHIFDSLHTDWGGTGSAEDIAASIRNARQSNLTLVTHNTRHFSHIPDIVLEDWIT